MIDNKGKQPVASICLTYLEHSSQSDINVPGNCYEVMEGDNCKKVWVNKGSAEQPKFNCSLRQWCGSMVFAMGDTKPAPYLFVVEFPVPEDFYTEFKAWYREEHVPMLLAGPDWLGTELYRTNIRETPYSFTSVHYLSHPRALDSEERHASRSTPWFFRLKVNSWFDQGFNRWLLKSTNGRERSLGIQMSQDKITYQDILQLVKIINSAECELHLKYGDLVLDIVKNNPNQAVVSQVDDRELKPPVKEVSNSNSNSAELRKNPVEATVTNSLPEVLKPPEDLPDHLVVVKSPMVGTFYRAPSPGAEPFVEVGQRVTKDDTVCIIDVMKIMNSVPAGTDGVVTHIFIEDVAPVEFGQALVAIDPTK